MEQTELLELVANGENSGIAFTREAIGSVQFARELVAFANLEGGRILIGVEDNGTLSGLQQLGTQGWTLQVCRDRVFPQFIPSYEEILLEEGLRIGVLTIPRGISKPYLFRNNEHDEIYIRMGNHSEIASKLQQKYLHSLHTAIYAEVLPVPGTTLISLDLVRFEYYLSHVLHDFEIPSNDPEWIERLSGLGLMAEDGWGSIVSTIAGLVCFGKNPSKYLPQAGIRVMAFSGDKKEYKALLDTKLDGPLVGRWEDVSGQKNLVDDGLLEKFSNTIRPFIAEESDNVDLHMRKTTHMKYPWEAIRETVVNALVHRDWTQSVDIEVVLYSDRMEITSPGKLPNSMTVEKMLAGQRTPRNPLIVEIMRDYGYVDARGMGVRTKVVPLIEQMNNREPQYILTEDYLKAVLPRS